MPTVWMGDDDVDRAVVRTGTALDADGADLPLARSVLAVCAHPDDESFGLGALLDRFAGADATVAVLSFTRGEASTLSAAGDALGGLRCAELHDAAAELGVSRVEVLDHPDGTLMSEPLDQLAAEVAMLAEEVRAELVLVFDEGGVTGHPDHCRATEAVLAGTRGIPVLAWTVPRAVADALNAELGAAFVGRSEDEIDVVVAVDRVRQLRAIACHASQSGDNPVLRRRLQLLGDSESLRWLRRPRPAGGPGTPGPPGETPFRPAS